MKYDYVICMAITKTKNRKNGEIPNLTKTSLSHTIQRT
jgi:hypothetical protein